MIISKIEEYKILLGWSPKCACTSIKAGILKSLGAEAREGVHIDFLKRCPHYNTKRDTTEGYKKFLVMREPIGRFISTILNRCKGMSQLPYPYMTTRNVLSMLYDNNMVSDSPITDGCYFSPDIRHHFKQQCTGDVKVEWDGIFDIKDDLNMIFKKIRQPGMPDIAFSSMNSTTGSLEPDGVFYGDIPFAYLPESPSKHPKSWLDDTMLEMVTKLYEEDFELMKSCETF